MTMDERADGIDGRNRAQIRKVTLHSENRTSRRQMLRQMAGVSLGLPLAQRKMLPVFAQVAAQQQADGRPGEPAPVSAQTVFSPEEEQFLDDLERSKFLFFWEQANPQTGLIKDRCNVRIADTSVAASIASTGFGLTQSALQKSAASFPTRRLVCASSRRSHFFGRRCRRIAAFPFTLPTLILAKEYGTPKVSSIDTSILLCGI